MVLSFIAVERRPVPADLVPYAVRDVERAVCDLINAANACTNGAEAMELQTTISDLVVSLEAAKAVAWTKEQSFFPKGA